MLSFSFDVGNGFVKARNSERRIIAPSTIAKKDSIGTSSITSMSNDYDVNAGYQTYVSNLDDSVEYIWGSGIKDAVDLDELISTYTHHNRYNQKRFKLLCSFILAELASDYNDHDLNDVVVVTGLPSQEVNTKEADDFKRFLQQKHLITRDGEQIVINVSDVRILEQPLGTLLDKFMNDAGKIHKKLMTSVITVIDFGAGTTIIDTFKNLKRLDDKSDTFWEGANDIHKRIAKAIEREYGVKGVDMHHVEAGFYDESMIAVVSERKKYPFKEIANKVISNFIEKRISDIDSTLTNRNGTDIFVGTGGGINIVGDTFEKEFNEESLVVVEDSQGANNDGFYKFSKAIALNKQKLKKAQ